MRLIFDSIVDDCWLAINLHCRDSCSLIGDLVQDSHNEETQRRVIPITFRDQRLTPCCRTSFLHILLHLTSFWLSIVIAPRMLAPAHIHVQLLSRTYLFSGIPRQRVFLDKNELLVQHSAGMILWRRILFKGTMCRSRYSILSTTFYPQLRPTVHGEVASRPDLCGASASYHL